MGTTSSTNIPPGPSNPLAILWIAKSAATVLTEHSRYYGPVFSFKAPGDPLTVVLNNYEVIREALIDNADAFPTRRTSELRKHWGLRGRVFYSLGEDQKRLREFAVTGFQDFCKTTLPAKLTNEAIHLCDVFEAKGGEAFDANEYIALAGGNIMAVANFGARYDYEDPKLRELMATLDYLHHALRPGPLVHKYPWLYDTFLYARLKQSQEYVRDLINAEVEKHQEDLDTAEPRDFIDLYLIRAKAEEDDDDALFQVSRAWYTIKDLFSSASNPGAAETQWMVALLCAYPDKQEKIYEEITSVIEGSRPPFYEDLQRMPYTHAFMHETMRYRGAVPFGTREVFRDVTVGGYTIPKGSNVMVNYWAAERDPEVWTDPEVFIPERFLGEDKKTITKPKHHIPLGIGHRDCPGQTLALMELFFFGVNLVQRFELQFSPTDPKPKMEGICGATVVVEDYKLVAVKR